MVPLYWYNPSMPRRYSDEDWLESLIRRTDQTGDCWIWTGPRSTYGYGALRYKGRRHSFAHRVMWQLMYGSIPSTLCVCHRCDNRLCIRPEHLFVGTNQENHEDKISKGRQARGERGYAKLTESEVLEIRRLHESGAAGFRKIARQFGVSATNVKAIVLRQSWKHLP